MLRKLITLIILVPLLVLLLDIGLYFVYPDVKELKKTCPRKTAFMKYREQEWARKGKKNKTIIQRWVPLSRISPFAIKAVIIAEDDKFWSHEGFDFEAIQKALEKDIKKKRFVAGGSTISQQLAKNLYLSPSKNPIRKIKEAILTWRIEKNLSKKRIIELYLNVVEWGDGIFGIEAAANRYFGKTASELTAKEAARLASVLPNPLRYNPVGTSRYVESRSNRIYEIMVRRGIVIPEYEEVMEEREKGREEGELDSRKTPEEMRKEEPNGEAREAYKQEVTPSPGNVPSKEKTQGVEQ